MVESAIYSDHHPHHLILPPPNGFTQLSYPGHAPKMISYTVTLKQVERSEYSIIKLNHPQSSLYESTDKIG